MVAIEKEVIDYYTHFWSKFIQKWQIHHSFSVENQNINEYIWSNLELDDTKNLKILDAGCGMGRTSIYLAKKHSKIQFSGITITQSEIDHVKQSAITNKVQTNTDFIRGN